MSDEITLTLSRADAELIADLADTGLDRETSFPSMDGFTPAYRAELDRLREDGQRVIKLIYAALAAPAADPAPEPDAPADVPDRATTCDDVQAPLARTVTHDLVLHCARSLWASDHLTPWDRALLTARQPYLRWSEKILEAAFCEPEDTLSARIAAEYEKTEDERSPWVECPMCGGDGGYAV